MKAWKRLGISGLLAGALASTGILAQESAGYRLDRLTVAAAAARASSPTYELSLTVAEQGPVGSQSFCNAGFFQSTGFWSVLGVVNVPIDLRVSRAPGVPDDVILAWSGSQDSFDVFRGPVAANVGSNLVQTVTTCSTPDSPPAVEISYYLVN